MEINDSFELTFSFTQEQVNLFATVTGDFNPIHLDESYASESIFGTRVMHGFLAGSVFSKIIGMHFPGNGAIYLSQTMDFLKPMFVNRPYKAEVKVIECIFDKNRFRLKTTIVDCGNDEITIDGVALIRYKINVQQ
ncbi:MAG: MaoC family dehydratase [Bacteroidetes bacterium]|nr:MaoC family dehydratase [Bacteroidota bacterium]